MSDKKIIYSIGEIVLGFLFVVSGVGKMMNAHGFGELISSYGFDWFSILAPLIIIFELLIGICLILQIKPRLSLLFCGVLLLGFTTAFTYANLINGIEDCGCFGDISTDLPAWATYIRNIVMLVLVIVLWRYECKNKGDTKNNLKWREHIVVIFIMVCAFWTGNTWAPSTFYMNQFAKVHPLIGKTVSETPLNKYFKASADSTYLVWVFSYSCGGCVNSIENVKKYQEGIADHFIPLAVTEDKDGKKSKLLGIPFSAKYVGEELSGFIETIPTLLYIREGKIEYLIEGSVPNVYIFRSLYLNQADSVILNKYY